MPPERAERSIDAIERFQSDRGRYLNARATLETLLAFGTVPIVNENDTVATDEIRFGDNDTLAALVANLVEADLLIFRTDQAGRVDSDPRSNPEASRIAEAEAGDISLESMASGSGGAIGQQGQQGTAHQPLAVVRHQDQIGIGNRLFEVGPQVRQRAVGDLAAGFPVDAQHVLVGGDDQGRCRGSDLPGGLFLA